MSERVRAGPFTPQPYRIPPLQASPHRDCHPVFPRTPGPLWDP